MSTVVERVIGRHKLIIESGKLAAQAHGAVTLRYGDTVVLVTAVMADKPRPDIDFLPLTVDYEERLYAVGKIPGSFFRREGRPGQEAVLSGRLADRSLRPLFPKSLRNDVQITITTLSVDQENPPEILGLLGASTALCISQIPFSVPVGACRVAYQGNQFIVNPTYQEIADSALTLVVSSTRDSIMMVEAGANQVSEDIILEGIRRAHEANLVAIDLIDELTRQVGKPKHVLPTNTEKGERLKDEVKAILNGRLAPLLKDNPEKTEQEHALNQLESQVVERLAAQYPADQVALAFHDLLKGEVRHRILEQGIRPDGRPLTEIRPVACEVGVLPRTHGSGLFTRGLTQVLSIATLASLGMKQKLDTVGPEDTKLFMHHYNFPSYSTGEARRVGSPGRREIGHGALAERALLPVLPSQDEFPYVIRVVSEVLSSNGSTSMGSVCGSSLALMHAGVPLKAPVAGIAMGLVIGENGRFAILSDIQGVEDNLGDMDFKVAGTAQGVNALQMDVKVQGLSQEVLRQALAQARVGRLQILEKMREAIAEPSSQISPYAPKMLRLKIPVEKIGALIGPGGRIIRAITEETGATIDVQDDGTVTIGAVSQAMLEQARDKVDSLTRELKVGDIFTGKVTRIASFGVFVELLPGRDGLIRSGDLGDTDGEVRMGQELTVVVQEIDFQGRVNLSRRALLGGDGERAPSFRPPARPPFDRGRPRPGGPSGGPPGGRGGPGDRDRGQRPGPRPGGTDRGFSGGGGFRTPGSPQPPPRS